MTTDSRDLIELTDQQIDPGRIRSHLVREAGGSSGGVCVFEGWTRGEVHAVHGRLMRLEYQAYSEMAIEMMRKLAADARAKWPVVALAMVHRTGVVPVGEPSVIIGVASGHRAEAFAACRWLIDELKRSVPIWKKEVWAGGESTWVNPAESGEIDKT
jgi:molybdopterin synthase catalytic subunit